MKKPSLIIFDVDGLMLDTEAVWLEAWGIIGEQLGDANLGKELFMKIVGRSGKEADEIILRSLPHVKEPLKLLDQARDLGFAMLETNLRKKPGLDDLLDCLEAHAIPKAVATSTPEAATRERLGKLGLWERFDYILCGDQVKKRKPDPEIYETVLRQMQTASADALVLEDSDIGVAAAWRAHIPCIMVPDLIMPTEKQQQQAIAIKKDLKEVCDLLEEIYSGK